MDRFEIPEFLRNKMAVAKETKWQSIAKWPNGETTTDTHDTKGMALSVCAILERDGFGGERKVFPVSTEAVPLPPNAAISRPAQEKT